VSRFVDTTAIYLRRRIFAQHRSCKLKSSNTKQQGIMQNETAHPQRQAENEIPLTLFEPGGAKPPCGVLPAVITPSDISLHFFK